MSEASQWPQTSVFSDTLKILCLDTNTAQGNLLESSVIPLQEDVDAALASMSGMYEDTLALIGDLQDDLTGHTGDTAAHIEALSWSALSYSNSWANYGSGWQAGQYAKDNEGNLHIIGLIYGEYSTANIIATLPTGYRPAYPQVVCSLLQRIGSGIQIADVRITTAGVIWLSNWSTLNGASTVGLVSLNLPSFPVS